MDITGMSQEQKDRMLEKLLKNNSAAKEVISPEEEINEERTEGTSSELETYKAALRKVRDAINSLSCNDEEELEEESVPMEDMESEDRMKEKAATSVAVKNLKGNLSK